MEEDLRHELNQVHKKLDSTKEEVDTLIVAKNEIRAIQDDHTNKLSAVTNTLAKQTETLDSAMRTLKDGEKKFADFQDTLEAVNKNLDDKKNVLHSMESIVGEQKDSLDSANRTLGNHSGDLGDMKQTLSTHGGDLRDIKNTLSNHGEDMALTKTSVTSMTKTLEDQGLTLKEQELSLLATNAKLDDISTKQETQGTAIQGMLAQIFVKLNSDYAQLREDKNRELEGIQVQLEEHRNSIQQLSESLSEARKDNEKLNKQLAQQVEETGRSQRDLSEADGKLRETQGNLNLLQENYDKLQGVKDSALHELKETREELASAQGTIAVKESDLVTLDREMKEHLAKKDQELEMFKSVSAGVTKVVASYLPMAEKLQSCPSTEELVAPYLPLDEASNQVKFLGKVGAERSFAIDVYNTMKRYKTANKADITAEEKEMIEELNRFYQKREDMEYDLLVIPDSNGKFDKNKLQDLEKPSNTAFRTYEEVYVPILMKDDKTTQFKGIVKGK